MDLQIVDLTRPHGFLVWRGKQQAIASPIPLPIGDVMITSDGEAFGIATLSQPAQLSLSEFHKEEQATKHCMRPEECKTLWPQAESFYLHDIKGWRGFNEPWLIVNPNSEVAIENSKGLLKTIIIHPDSNGVEDLAVTLEAHFNCVKHEGSKALPFYELKLAGEPTLRFVKKKEAAMPYEVNEDECVVNADTGEVEKCHESHEEAMAHMAALNMNVEKSEEKAHISDEEIRALGGKYKFAKVGIADEEKAGRRMAGGMMDKLRTAMQMIQELMMWGEYHEEEPEEEMMTDLMKGHNSGVAVKMVAGEPWHLSWSSNAFEDRDQEIFSLKSLEQYVQENSENEVKGWFNLWHIKGTDFAEKRFQAIVGKFLFEAGPYLKDAKGQAALKFFKQYSAGHPEIAPEGWGASIEYKYLPEERKEKVYQWTWITRTSTLARGAAANVWTKSTQETLKMNDEQRKAAEAIFGKEFTDQLIVQGQQKTAELEAAGIANKQVAPEVAPVVETTPAETLAIDPGKLVQDVTIAVQTSLNEAIAPVFQSFQEQMTLQGQQIVALTEELEKMKGEQALKSAVELPRWTFNAVRASQSASTVVPEGDALKNQRPAETKPVPSGGSVVANYFPSAKG